LDARAVKPDGRQLTADLLFKGLMLCSVLAIYYDPHAFVAVGRGCEGQGEQAG